MNETYKRIVENMEWEKMNGLIPQIIQDEDGKILTLGYTNEETLTKTFETGLVHYFSRSKGRVRMKGETSGNYQKLKRVSTDCDNDALLLTVEQVGNACHTGNYSCFESGVEIMQNEIPDYSLAVLKELEETIEMRKKDGSEGSYTSYLFKEGKEKIYKKFGEEAVEILVAESKKQTVYETADMIYHLLVLLNYNDIRLEEVMAELGRRRK